LTDLFHIAAEQLLPGLATQMELSAGMPARLAFSIALHTQGESR